MIITPHLGRAAVLLLVRESDRHHAHDDPLQPNFAHHHPRLDSQTPTTLASAHRQPRPSHCRWAGAIPK